MATGGLSVEPDQMECIVCHSPFKIPKLLPCGHLLCRHCLVTWLKSKPEANCPTCRSSIVDPKERKGRSFEDVADDFPTDLSMEALVQADGLLSKQHVCCVCVNVAAASLCRNCSDMFCGPCSTVHKKQSLSKHHKVEALTSLTPETLAADRPAPCAVHDDKLSEVYCPKHGASICLLCATTDHRQCPEVMKLETRMKESCVVLAELAAMLSKGETDLDKAIAQLDRDLKDIDKQTQDNIAEMEATCDRLESTVKACRRRLKELALISNSNSKTKVNDGKTILLKRRGRMTSHKNIVERVQGFSKHGSFGDMTTAMKTRVYGLDCSATLPSDVKDAAFMSFTSFTLDSQAVTRIEQELSQLGQLRATPVDGGPKTAVLRFHDNHGKKIMMCNNHQTAQRTSTDKRDGIVMSKDPMVMSRLYEVHIDETNNEYRGTVLGVVTNSPDTFTLPPFFRRSIPDVVCVTKGGVWVFGQLKCEERPVLRKLPVGSRVGLAVHTETSLHLYVDGKHQGVVAPHIPQPCYFMFDLFGYCTKVTALPVKPIN